MLELICTRESGAVFEAGGLNCVLTFIRDSGHLVHKDTLHSAMAVVSRLCGKMEPQDSSLEICVESLSSLLKHEDHQASKSLLFTLVSKGILYCSLFIAVISFNLDFSVDKVEVIPSSSHFILL